MTKIQWTNKTWNPIIGCSKISPGCQNCYAEKMAKRLAAMGIDAYSAVVHQKTRMIDEDYGHWTGTTAFVESAIDKPLRWEKPSMIFVCSMGDIFHESVPFSWVTEVMWIIAQCRLIHTFQILTKRPERMKEYFGLPKTYYKQNRPDEWPLPNLWLGVTAENQEQADKRIPILLDIPAAVRFVSVEPMLERIDIYQYLGGKRDIKPPHKYNGGIDWAIVGCESGHHRRPCQMEWVESIVGQCDGACVPVFVKQLSINGKVSKEPSEWPQHLRVREFPKAR